MPDKFRKTKSGATATSPKGKVYHSSSLAKAKKAARNREVFKHMKGK